MSHILHLSVGFLTRTFTCLIVGKGAFDGGLIRLRFIFCSKDISWKVCVHLGFMVGEGGTQYLIENRPLDF